MSEHDSGQVSGSAAEIYDGFFVPALFGRFAPAIADVAALDGFEGVVDVACGTGALTRELRSRTQGRVAGVDVNPAMLEIARQRGEPIEYLEGDALALPFADAEFNVATSQFGLMFLADPVAGLREMNRVADRGTVAIWDSIGRSEGYVALQALFARTLGDDAAASLDAPFAMGTDGLLERTLEEAGLGGASIQSIPGSARFADIGEWVTTEVRGWTLGESVSDADLQAVIDTANVELAEFLQPDGCVVPMAAKVARWS